MDPAHQDLSNGTKNTMGVPWFEKSQCDKQNKQTIFFHTEYVFISLLLL